MSVWGGADWVKFDGIGEAVDSMISLIATATAFVFPFACKIKAAAPATNGPEEKVVNQWRGYGRANRSAQLALVVPPMVRYVLFRKVL